MVGARQWVQYVQAGASPQGTRVPVSLCVCAPCGEAQQEVCSTPPPCPMCVCV